MLAGGVDVAADVEPVLGDVVAGEAAGDLLLGLQGADAALEMLFVSQTLVSAANRSTSACLVLQNSRTLPRTAAAPCFPPQWTRQAQQQCTGSAKLTYPRNQAVSRRAGANCQGDRPAILEAEADGMDVLLDVGDVPGRGRE